MTEENGGVVRAVAWSEILPWLNLFRTFRLATGIRVLLLAAVGLLLMLLGWWFLRRLCYGRPAERAEGRLTAPVWVRPFQDRPWGAMQGWIHDRPWIFEAASGVRPPALPPGATAEGETVKEVPAAAATPSIVRETYSDRSPIYRAWHLLSMPFLGIFSSAIDFRGLVCLVLFGLWGLAVWAAFGGAITRIVSVQLACEERLGWSAVAHHVASKWLAYFAAPLFPLLGVATASIPLALLGLLGRTAAGTFLLALLWPLFLVAGLIMALLLLGLIFGWPLMWATISTEGTDSFDALSRSYAYLFQRPLHYLFYVLVAGAFGLLGWLLVSQFAAGVIGLTHWAVSWGAGAQGLQGGPGGDLIWFWEECVKLIALGFVFSYFWTASTAIYYLLRQNVDATEMDEVFLDEEEQQYSLPPLRTEEPGAPATAETPVEKPVATPAEKPVETPAASPAAAAPVEPKSPPEGAA